MSVLVRARVQGEPADHVRRGPERERDGALRGGGGAHRRHLQVGVQQHRAQALQPAARRQGVVSTATYTPVTPADYGTLFYWTNTIGHQQSSCFFTVIAPAPIKGAIAASSARPSASSGIYFSLKDSLLGITIRESLGLNGDQELNAETRQSLSKDCLLGITARESLGLNEDQELNSKTRQTLIILD
ncbi:hypothetical protein CEXT_229701 [Caerostris extrusa]|uniref:Uncharacterized protein n=1 Tax=Caerostris extrusa TaxID=172846 RepID=A0AAV4SZ08_CAEEX|nr:hypothetical protein CEXT_229701 [Caerostris extrusa]